MIQLATSGFDGLYVVENLVHNDLRGKFSKQFSKSSFQNFGVDECDFKEIYFSKSAINVLRGLHFQNPPFDHAKLISCLEGHIFDVALDLRKQSPTFGQVYSCELMGSSGKSLYIPRGFAHGFYVIAGPATLSYAVTSEHEPKADTGILWSSVNIQWPTATPILSDRDNTFTPFQEFSSPF